MKASRIPTVPLLVIAWLGVCVSSGRAQEASSCASRNLGRTEIVVNGAHLGAAPAQLQLKPGEEYDVVFRQPGYDDARTHLSGEAEAKWVVLDVFSGVLGYALDPETDNWTFVELAPQIVAEPQASDGTTEDATSG